jgi:hypothetical protein
MTATPKPRAGEHTKGPWQINGGGGTGFSTGNIGGGESFVRISGSNGQEICRTNEKWSAAADIAMQNNELTHEQARPDYANARRIVACVNYCEGVSTAEIDAAPASTNLQAILRMIDGDLPRFIAERDHLVAQLETCKAAHMSNCLDADKLRTRIAELREVLEHVCDTISGPAPALRRAREILAKHGR